MKIARAKAARAVWTSLAIAAVLAVSSHWLKKIRFAAPELWAVSVYRVTSGADAGPGSLREGILAADRTNGRARVVIAVSRIDLETPLPPLVNPDGVVVDATPSGAILDASRLQGGPVLDLVAPDCVIAGLQIVHSPAEAILVRKGGARLRRITVTGGGVAVFQGDDASDLVVEASTFERNTVGVHLAASGASVKLLDNRFVSHRRAAVWAVAAAPLLTPQLGGVDILRNRFIGDDQSIVIFNLQARLEANTLENANGAAIYVHGTRFAISHNRIRAGRNFGISVEESEHGLIDQNEIDHNCAGGIIVRNARNTMVSANRLYANGYGVIVMEGKSVSPNTITGNLITQHIGDALYVIGGSPILRHNRLLQNQKAGLRFSSLETISREMLTPNPLLDENQIVGNGRDDILRDRYTESKTPSLSTSGDCSWRSTMGPVEAVRVGGQS
jgi:parallel beta-helix repeat protein